MTPTPTHTCWHTPWSWEKETAVMACSLVWGWGGGGPRAMGRLRVCHINNSLVGWSRVINMASHCRPSEPRNPAVMAAAGPQFPEGQLRKRRWLWGTSALISPLRLQPAASKPGIHFKKNSSNWFFNNYISYLCPSICLYYGLIFATGVGPDSLSPSSCPWKIQCKLARALKFMNTVLFINPRVMNQWIAPCMWLAIVKRL